MKRLLRDRWDKKVAGVCAGLGRYLKVDPTIIRMGVVILCIFSGVLPLLIAYIIASLIIPLGPKTYIQFECKKLYRSRKNRKLGGVCGGLSEMLKIDATIIRVIFFITMVLTGFFPLLITYVIATAIIPEKT